MTAPKVIGVDAPKYPYDRPCDTCGATFTVLPCYARKAVQRGYSLPRFCSRKCQLESYRGDGNPKWRGGRCYAASGYVYAYAPDHPNATQDGYVMEHRLVMEKAIGRILTRAEEVHHKNHVRDDNRIENLELMASKEVHRVHHAYYQQDPCGRCGLPVQRSIAHRRRWVRAFCSRRCAAAAASESSAAQWRSRRA